MTLFTLPVCPRCDLIKSRLNSVNIPYTENTDEAAAAQFSDKFWPIGIDSEGNVYEFPELLEYIEKIKRELNTL